MTKPDISAKDTKQTTKSTVEKKMKTNDGKTVSKQVASASRRKSTKAAEPVVEERKSTPRAKSTAAKK